MGVRQISDKKYLGYILVGIYTVSRNTWVIYWWVYILYQEIHGLYTGGYMYVQEHEMI